MDSCRRVPPRSSCPSRNRKEARRGERLGDEPSTCAAADEIRRRQTSSVPHGSPSRTHTQTCAVATCASAVAAGCLRKQIGPQAVKLQRSSARRVQGEGQFFSASLFGRGDGEGSVHDDKVRLATLAHRRGITPCTMTASAPPPRSSPPFPDSGKFYSPFASRSRCFRALLQAPAAKVAARLSRTQVCGAVRCRDGGGVRCGGLCWRCG